MTHACVWNGEEDGWFIPRCTCGWTFGPVPDIETMADVLMAHAYEAGQKEALS